VTFCVCNIEAAVRPVGEPLRTGAPRGLARGGSAERSLPGRPAITGIAVFACASDVVNSLSYRIDSINRVAFPQSQIKIPVGRHHDRPWAVQGRGMDRRAYMKAKFNDDVRLAAIHDRLTEMGQQVSIAYAFDRIERAPNTLDAHRLIRWASVGDKQDAVVDRLFRLYFEEGRDVGDRKLLIEVAHECAMDAELVEKRYADGDDVDSVQAEIAQAQAVGVSGVPFFIFASRFGVPGAQDADVLAKAIAQARAAQSGVEVA